MRRSKIIAGLAIAAFTLSGCASMQTAFLGKKEKKAPCKFASMEIDAEMLKDCGFEIPLNQQIVKPGTLERLPAKKPDNA